MPRPQDKTQLLQLSKEHFAQLTALIASFPEDTLQQPFPEQYMNRNVRDVLAHLHQWHLFFLDWYKTGMAGAKPVMPAQGYTWKTVPELNRHINEQYRTVKLPKVQALLNESYQKVQDIIAKHSNEELFEKKRYAWTGSTSLGSYLVSATSSHYDWAIKLIKKALR